MIHTVKGFGIVSKAEVDVFLELSCFFNDPTNVGNLISGSLTFSKSSLNIWKFTVHVLLKPDWENFEHQEASCLYPSEGRQKENHNHRKLTKLITWTTALSDSMKLWAKLCRAFQDGQVMVESSDKTWSTGEGTGKPLQYPCLGNPMNSMKRQKDRTLKDELPRSEVPNMLLEISGELTPERMKRWSQSKNNTQLWMWLLMDVKSDDVKSNIA